MHKSKDYGLLHAAVHLACAAQGPYADTRCPLLDVTKGLPSPCTTALDRRLQKWLGATPCHRLPRTSLFHLDAHQHPTLDPSQHRDLIQMLFSRLRVRETNPTGNYSRRDAWTLLFNISREILGLDNAFADIYVL